MSSMENECNLLQWKTLPNTPAQCKSMCCQRYVILHATRRSERTHLWVQERRCKNTQTSGSWLFGFLHNEARWQMEPERDSRIFHISLDCYYSSLAPRARVFCHFFIYSAGPHGGIYPQTDSGTERQRDWITLFTKQGSITPVFALNLSLTPRCPFCLPVVLNAVPNFLSPFKARWSVYPPCRCNLWSKKIHEWAERYFESTWKKGERSSSCKHVSCFGASCFLCLT